MAELDAAEVYGYYAGNYGGNLSPEDFSEFWGQVVIDGDRRSLLALFKAEGSHRSDPIPTGNGIAHHLHTLRMCEMSASE